MQCWADVRATYRKQQTRQPPTLNGGEREEERILYFSEVTRLRAVSRKFCRRL